jgi:hypothetical protein
MTECEVIVKCPHCNDFVVIEKMNCKIFRHGILISNGTQIDPHASKELCNFFLYKKMIYGCGKPFRIIERENILITEICDYI